ncbi:MAG: hypothetical protein ACUVRI_08115 [Armatimonadota bacterium]
MAFARQLSNLLAVFCFCLLQHAGASVVVQESSERARIEAALREAFRGARVVDLRTSEVSSVVTLRDVVKIPPPSTPVLVKVFRKNELPPVLREVFVRPGVSGVTIFGRYVAILETEFRKEQEDILRHELVHAYITLVSPRPLPLWFQEASAVMFSTGKSRKFYGKPSETYPRMIVGKLVELHQLYSQKLHSFEYLLERAGKKRFYSWLRSCVVTGEVDPGVLLDENKAHVGTVEKKGIGLPVWLWFVVGTVVVVVLILGFYLTRIGVHS